ncbi:NAD(P)H-hydrate epimerase, partial [Streptomyces scabiei]|uniref:NAD(P)H-hydrate epimerase n=1 Tax=Streptomyces scabiei TaxID=1930 RepID=UPI0029BD5782
MRSAHRVETVRTAERTLMARLPDGALMQRAAAGLAAACADILPRRVYGSRVVVLTGSGDNGGDALYAGARLARRGAGVTAVLLSPDRTHQAALAADADDAVVAVDLPSGIEADTGEVYGEAVRADLTVTFGTHKPGLLVDPARTYAGSVRLVDIGLADTLPATPALESLQ